MIGLLRGTIAHRDTTSLIVDVNGVGYKVLVANNLLTKSVLGEEITLFTHTHVREDVLELYGFAEHNDLKLFELLIGVSGIGCRTALNVFSIGGRSDIVDAILTNEVSFFIGVPRLGKKNAQKIIIELKGKLGSTEEFDLAAEETRDGEDVIEVLKSFGFSSREAQSAIRAVGQDAETTEEKVRLALKYLGK